MKASITRLIPILAFSGLIALTIFHIPFAAAQTNNGKKGISDPVLVDSSYTLYQSGNTYLAGQPMQDDLEALAKEGVTLVINVRTAPEMKTFAKEYFDEEVVVKGLNMDYLQVGVGGQNGYKPEVIDAISESISATDGKVLIHCAAAGRATMVWMAWLVRNNRCSVDEAVRIGKLARFSFPFEDMLGVPLTMKKSKK